MKRKEIMIIGATAILAAIFSIILSGAVFGSPKKNAIKVPVVSKIDPVFPTPQTDETYNTFFNDKAIDPTQLIQIGDQSNATPFQGSDQ